MDNPVRIVNVRLPQQLIEKIDTHIAKEQMYTTRPDYIIDSLRVLFNWTLTTRNIVDDDEDRQSFITTLRMFYMRNTFEMLMGEYREFGGKPVQVILRIPSGLYKMIDEYTDRYRPYSDFMQFLRSSIIYGFHYNSDMLNMTDSDTYEADPIYDFEKMGDNLEEMLNDEESREIITRICNKNRNRHR